MAVPDAHDSPPPLGRPPPPQHPIPVSSSTSHLLRPSSTSLDVPSPYDFTTLEAFERQEKQLWKDSLELQKRGDNAMTALGNSSVVILLGYIGLVVLQSLRDWHLSCCLTGFGWAIATLFSFGGCCCASLVAAVVRLRLLSPLSTQLIYRHRIHILSIEAFKDQLRGRGLLKSQSAFGRRLGALGVLTVSPNARDFSVYYMETLIWLSVDVLVALTIYMMAGVIFCNGDGGSLEMSYTY